MWRIMVERKHGNFDTAHNPKHKCPWCRSRAAYIGQTVQDDGMTVYTFQCRKCGLYETDGARGRGWQQMREEPKPAEGGEQRPGASMPPITRPDW